MKRCYTLITIIGLAMSAPAFAGDARCDYDGNGACDSADQEIIMGAVGAQDGDAGFVPAADHDGDGVISLVDVSAFLDLRGN